MRSLTVGRFTSKPPDATMPIRGSGVDAGRPGRPPTPSDGPDEPPYDEEDEYDEDEVAIGEETTELPAAAGRSLAAPAAAGAPDSDAEDTEDAEAPEDSTEHEPAPAGPRRARTQRRRRGVAVAAALAGAGLVAAGAWWALTADSKAPAVSRPTVPSTVGSDGVPPLPDPSGPQFSEPLPDEPLDGGADTERDGAPARPGAPGARPDADADRPAAAPRGDTAAPPARGSVRSPTAPPAQFQPPPDYSYQSPAIDDPSAEDPAVPPDQRTDSRDTERKRPLDALTPDRGPDDRRPEQPLDGTVGDLGGLGGGR